MDASSTSPANASPNYQDEIDLSEVPSAAFQLKAAGPERRLQRPTVLTYCNETGCGDQEVLRDQFTPGRRGSTSGGRQEAVNYVIDYGTLRRSGYFLSPLQPEPPKSPLPEGQFDKTELIQNWMTTCPDSTSELDSASLNSLISVPSRLIATLEDWFLQTIIDFKGNVQCNKKQEKVLRSWEIEKILEATDDTIEKVLVQHGSTASPYEYVCASIELPKRDSKQTSGSYVGFFARVFNWILSFWKRDEAEVIPRHDSSNMEPVMIEPYKGPVRLNGATIASQTQSLEQWSLIEEVKTFLKAIAEALRLVKDPPPKKSTIKDDDPEMETLAAVLSLNKKKCTRTLFSVPNLDKAPVYPYSYRRRRAGNQISGVYQKRNGFIRKCNGWISRRDTGLAPRTSNSLLSAAIRNMVPVTPAIPVYQLRHGTRRPRQNQVVPTRYQISRSQRTVYL